MSDLRGRPITWYPDESEGSGEALQHCRSSASLPGLTVVWYFDRVCPIITVELGKELREIALRVLRVHPCVARVVRAMPQTGHDGLLTSWSVSRGEDGHGDDWQPVVPEDVDWKSV